MHPKFSTPKIKAGFTLVELMIVIAIIAVLATIAIPTYQNYIKKAAIAELIQAGVPYRSDVELCIYATASINGCSAGSNGIQANATGANSKYLLSATVANGIISVAGKNNLADISYKMTPKGSTAEAYKPGDIINWQISCTDPDGLFPAGFCSL